MYIKGVGMSKYGILSESAPELAYQVAYDALEDANLRIDDIDAIVLADCGAMAMRHQAHNSSLLSSLFQTHKPIIRLEVACASGTAALWTGMRLGYDRVLVIGLEKMMEGNQAQRIDVIASASERQWEQPDGMIFPGEYAIMAQQHFQKYGSNSDDLALVAFKNHENANLNPLAHFYGKQVTLEKIKKSFIIASPLRLFDCCPMSDGAAAVVLTKDKTDIKIAGSALHTDYLPVFEREDMCGLKAARLAAKEAYKQAGVSSNNIDVAEVHDCFTIAEIMAYEDVGFAKKGEGHLLIRNGDTNLDGKIPVNASGGLKGKGHPIAATGLGQIGEITKQLKGEAVQRQVDGAKIGLVHNVGGSGSTVTVHILKKEG
jgi:acetyl-CoA C-acetyltransferase